MKNVSVLAAEVALRVSEVCVVDGQYARGKAARERRLLDLRPLIDGVPATASTYNACDNIRGRN